MSFAEKRKQTAKAGPSTTPPNNDYILDRKEDSDKSNSKGERSPKEEVKVYTTRRGYVNLIYD